MKRTEYKTGKVTVGLVAQGGSSFHSRVTEDLTNGKQRTKLSLVMTKVNIHQAKTQLSRLVDLAAGGKEIVIAKAGKPVARLVPYVTKTEARRLGQLRGKIKIKKNFDAPLSSQLLDAFEGKP